jgi:UDP-glucose 4-epimerase
VRVLVTGGAGFIGSHIADALLGGGHQVAVVDDLSTGDRSNVPAGAELIVGDVSGPEIERIIADVRPTAIFHHAAQMDVRRSMADAGFDTLVNVVGTARVANAALACGTETVVFASSGGAMYGESDVVPSPESLPWRAASPYGVAKGCGELYLEHYARRGLCAVSLRYGNVYGPRQNPHGEAGVVAIFATKLLAGERPKINGDGKQTRDYVYVGDVVRANLAALERTVSGAFNIGTGVETDVLTLATLLERLSGEGGGFLHGPEKPGEQRRSSLDITLAARELGWRPAVRLADGLERTFRWFAERGR